MGQLFSLLLLVGFIGAYFKWIAAAVIAYFGYRWGRAASQNRPAATATSRVTVNVGRIFAPTQSSSASPPRSSMTTARTLELRWVSTHCGNHVTPGPVVYHSTCNRSSARRPARQTVAASRDGAASTPMARSFTGTDAESVSDSHSPASNTTDPTDFGSHIDSRSARN